jgi:hypothetical protein
VTVTMILQIMLLGLTILNRVTEDMPPERRQEAW